MILRTCLGPMLGLVCLVVGCKVGGEGGPGGKATVDCLGASGQINCDVRHTEGGRGISACWDLRFDCANGTIAEAKKVCQDVAPGKTARKVVPLSALSNADRCDKVVKSQVLNLALSDAPAVP